MKQRFKTIAGRICYVLAVVLLAFIAALALWATKTFQVSLDAILATFGGQMEGANSQVTVVKAVLFVAPFVLAALALAVALTLAQARATARAQKMHQPQESTTTTGVLQASTQNHVDSKARTLGRARRGLLMGLAVIAVVMLGVANQRFGVISYLVESNTPSQLYETYYVDPKTVKIEAPARPKNLIWIYVESLETTYAAKEDGGIQDEGVIDNLTHLAQDNVSFSSTEKLGGFRSYMGTTWTMAGLLSTSSGTPLLLDAAAEPNSALPFDQETLTQQSEFMSGLTTLGDVLLDAGYTNEFLCGSDATFGGRRLFFERHGNYSFFDLEYAHQMGYLPEDYHVWWGFEDQKVFQFARLEAARLAASSQPFNLTVLTSDMHFPEGYVCELCGTDHSSKTANVVACVDRQVASFVSWVQEQPFADDTLVVITGDHPRMDTELVGETPFLERTVYNAFINATGADQTRQKNRELSHFDMFPSVLSALGFTIEGERLGFGTNLFSNQSTLTEQMGVAEFNTQIRRKTDWYVPHLAPEVMSGAEATE